jgi:hypothetical protein
MSRVERTENPRQESPRSEQSREAARRRDIESQSKTTPTKAEGELSDIEQALKNQKE